LLKLRALGVWSIFFVVFLGWRLPEVWRLYRLANEGARTTGTVIEVKPEHHNLVTYSYSVASQEYRGTEGRRSAQVGDIWPIYYLPSHPEVSSSGSPTIESVFREEVISTLFNAIVFPSIVVWAFWVGRWRNGSKQ
jgi:hypothetical protein